ncbi:MAG TPA: hypothetical protein VG650_02275 [Mycobacteriales bacterium]|nr:hypothetical protein [Mycobacteriales bacterium]
MSLPLPNFLSMRARLRGSLLVIVAALATVVGLPAAANTPSFTPYQPPTFHCPVVHRYGNGVAPKPGTTTGNTLCVVYNKRDITADNGGAIRFALAEPARFAVAGKCQYWQRDHWKVRLDRGFGKVVQWDGSYWWDLRAGYGGAILRHFQIAGAPVGPYQAARAIATVSPPLAAAFRKYGAGPGGGFGASVTLPSGIGC